MIKAILSHIDLSDANHQKSARYNNCVEDLTSCPELLRLNEFSQHLQTSRLQHSLNVSYYSYLVCKALRMDYRAAARAGLMHDFYLYDHRSENQKSSFHAKHHPKVALDNAKKHVTLSHIEADAIENHMWPLTKKCPKYKESYVVSCMDKYCAVCEVIDSLTGKVKCAFSRKYQRNSYV